MVERGSAEHGPLRDEPPADDDPPERVDPPPAADQDEAEMRRLRHDMAVANDWNPADGRT
jgi:hypothetical protein